MFPGPSTLQDRQLEKRVRMEGVVFVVGMGKGQSFLSSLRLGPTVPRGGVQLWPCFLRRRKGSRDEFPDAKDREECTLLLG